MGLDLLQEVAASPVGTVVVDLFSTPLAVVLALLTCAIAAAWLRRIGQRRRVEPGVPTYEAVPTLLTPAERSFFGVLQQALPTGYQVFAKVRLADLVRPVRNSSRSGWQSAFNRIAGKHVDFVVCDAASLQVVGVIELDDRTHNSFERGVRDTLVDSALADAGVPVLRVPARQAYSPVQVREQVENCFRTSRGGAEEAWRSA